MEQHLCRNFMHPEFISRRIRLVQFVVQCTSLPGIWSSIPCTTRTAPPMNWGPVVFSMIVIHIRILHKWHGRGGDTYVHKRMHTGV